MLRICNHRGIKFFENLLLFVIGQITDWLVFDNPLTPFEFWNLVAEALGVSADLVKLPGPQPDSDVLYSTSTFELHPPG